MAPGVGEGRTYSVAPSPARHEDYVPELADEREILDPKEPPVRLDLRAPWYRVGDQGETGSCMGWALADSVLWRQLVNVGRIAEEDRLSPRFIWMAAKEMRAKKTLITGAPEWHPTTFLEQGVSDAKSALAVARTFGAALEQDLPFHGHLYPGDVDRFYDRAGRQKIDAYYRLDPEGAPIGLTAGLWRRWIHQHGPVLLVVQVDRAFVDGPPVLDAFDAASADYMHAVAITGYEPGAFYLRCSWGEGWGQAGYAIATEAYLEGAMRESYGVVVLPDES